MRNAIHIFVVVAVALLVAISILSAWAQLSAQNSSVGPPPLALQTSKALQLAADQACLQPQPCGIETARQFARQIAAVAPTSALPYTYLAIASAQSGDATGSEKAAREALRRTPRATLAHAIMADAAGRRGDVQARLFHLERLLELETPNQQVLLDAIADLAITPSGKALVAQRVQEKPFWAEPVLNTLVERNLDPLFLLSIARGYPKVQDRLLTTLFEQRGPQTAFLGWLETASPDLVRSLNWPIDPVFERVDSRAPFNWALRSDGVEFEKTGGLYASYSGRGRQAMVDQVIMLGPGSYTFSTEMSGQLELRSGLFGWTIECVPSGAELANMRVEKLSSALSAFTTTFSVPTEDCLAQRVTLLGLPGEFPRRARGTVKSVRITPQQKPATTVGTIPAGPRKQTSAAPSQATASPEPADNGPRP